jgi:preprotein translocase subunit SecE
MSLSDLTGCPNGGKKIMIKRIREFFDGVVFEMKKVSWPTWGELKGSTIVVLILSLILSVFLFVVDLVLSKIVHLIL